MATHARYNPCFIAIPIDYRLLFLDTQAEQILFNTARGNMLKVRNSCIFRAKKTPIAGGNGLAKPPRQYIPLYTRSLSQQDHSVFVIPTA